MAEFLVKTALTFLLALAAIWGWNTLFGEYKTFEYTYVNVLAAWCIGSLLNYQ